MKATIKKLKNTAIYLAFCGTALTAEAKHIETECQQENGLVRVEVRETSNGHKAFVYERGRQIASRMVSSQRVTDGQGYSEQTRIIYKGGKVLSGGLNLRVIIEKPEMVDVEGTAHLTIKRRGRTSNILMYCDKHP